jgi:hypothetical protein
VTGFASSYADARAAFRDAASARGWSWRAFPIPDEGAAGDLSVDVATSPDPGAKAVLVVSSGLHGVEGCLGSAVQVQLIDRWRALAGTSRTRAVLIHALNPYGFARSRRVDADNIDPNRNFLDSAAEYSGCPEVYAAFDPLLNPRRPPARWDLFTVRALTAIAVHGRRSLRTAIVTGQYEFPNGLFFGGRGRSQTHRLLERHMSSWIGAPAAAVHLDVHTGLGTWGTHKLLVDYPLDTGRRDRLTRWFGADAFLDQAPDGVSYRARGSFGPWCVSRGFAPDYTFAFLEFGTYGDVAVVAGLRRENQAHHWGRLGDRATADAKARLRELFCPASPAWRARALTDALAVIERAVRGLDGLA